MKIVQNFQEILKENKYDTIACDIYGVIHDGIQAYPFATSALKQLKDNNERVVLLSNSTRLQDKLETSMASKFGIEGTLYEGILSSGTLTKLFLEDIAAYKVSSQQGASCHATVVKEGKQRRMEPKEFADRYLKTGRFFLAGDPDWQEPLYVHLAPTIERVHSYESIDFVLLGSIRGLFPDTNPVDPFDEKAVRRDYQPLLDACLERGIPIICANPDVFAPNGVNQDGSTKLLICPGYIGKMYEQMGGEVLYFGKPFPSIYDYLIAHHSTLENESSSNKIICVGDNVATDVRVGGISTQEINALELEFLRLIDWRLCSTGPILQQYYANLVEQHPCYERTLSISKSGSKGKKRRRSSASAIETILSENIEQVDDDLSSSDTENIKIEEERTQKHFDTLLEDDSIPYIA
ncbi:Putative Alternative cyclin Pho80 [Rhizopus microsporus]|nr:Putative Alternative cyclin Pho80 [Rhizopus microsporus]